MNPRISLTSHVTDNKRLESLMLKDIPVVPPDSVIKTFSHLKGNDVDLVLSQDAEDLSSGSFVIKQGDWARFFLDVWFDPLYRSYNFAKAEKHALVLPFKTLPLSRSFFILLNGENQRQANNIFLLAYRTTSCNGIRQFSPGWPSCLSGSSTPTTREPPPRLPTAPTRKGTLSSTLPRVITTSL